MREILTPASYKYWCVLLKRVLHESGALCGSTCRTRLVHRRNSTCLRAMLIASVSAPRVCTRVNPQ